MSTKKFTISSVCPLCGKDSTLQLEANELKQLEANPADIPGELEGRTREELEGRVQDALAGRPPRIELTCSSCGKKHLEDLSNTCAEWDDYCKEVHPIQEV